MGKGVYEWEWPKDIGGKGRFVREPNGTVRYWPTEADWSAKWTPQTWDKIVEAMSLDPEPSLPHDETPVMGEIVGWRVWRYSAPYLASLWKSLIWAPGAPVLGSLATDDGGVYAFKDKSRALTLYKEWTNTDRPVLGTVDLWGSVIETEYGYRAEYAAVRSIEMVHARPSKSFWRRRLFEPQWAVVSPSLRELRALYDCETEKQETPT